MQHNNTRIKSQLAYSLFKDMGSSELEYSYRGKFDNSIVEKILSLTECNLSEINETTSLKKRVYFILVEGLQNITRHQEISLKDWDAFFMICRRPEAYYITLGNVVNKNSVGLLRKKIDTINKMGADQLKDYSRLVLKMGSFSSKGGAGLGLIEMARKSSKPLLYDFIELGNGLYYFYLHVCVPLASRFSEQVMVFQDKNAKYIINLHQLLIKNQISVNFSGVLTQDILIYLVSCIDSQLFANQIVKGKANSIVIELLQNICKNSVSFVENNNTPYGLFCMSKDEEHLVLTAGNYISNTLVDSLKTSIDSVNNAPEDKLHQMKKQLDEENLSYVCLKNKSNHSLAYDFLKVNDNLSFFYLAIYLDSK